MAEISDLAKKASVVVLIDDDQMYGISDLLTEDAVVVLARRVEADTPEPEADHGSDSTAGAVDVRGLEIDLYGHQVRYGGRPLALTEQEFAIVRCLAGDPGRACSFEEILANAWGSTHVMPSVVHSAIRRLRIKLAAADAGVVIESVRGYGFRIAPD